MVLDRKGGLSVHDIPSAQPGINLLLQPPVSPDVTGRFPAAYGTQRSAAGRRETALTAAFMGSVSDRAEDGDSPWRVRVPLNIATRRVRGPADPTAAAPSRLHLQEPVDAGNIGLPTACPACPPPALLSPSRASTPRP